MAVPFAYNLRSLAVRRVSVAMTAGGVALVVAVFLATLALAGGLERAFVETGQPENVLVIRQGSLVETSSALSREQWQVLRFLPGVARDAGGQPVASAEVVVLFYLQRPDGVAANVMMRGVGRQGFLLRPRLRLVAGRRFVPGRREVIVAASLARRFVGLDLGARVPLGSESWRIVGLFEAGRTAVDSEIWGDAEEVARAYDRDQFSSALLRTTGRAQRDALIERVAGDPRLALKPLVETDYYAEQTVSARPVKFVGLFMAGVMAVGAAFAAMNTMYAAVASRGQEIATMRLLGFRRRQILTAFLLESLLVALVGGVLGCLLALPLNGLSTGTVNFRTFSEVTFDFRIGWDLILDGLLFAAAVGLAGGLLPAVRAARQPLATAIRAE
ncbi:MAG TPA: ABC transporter permease [Thermodesulfobacteriota bacterium]